MNRTRIIILSVVGIGAALLLWRVASSAYFTPRAALLTRIERVSREIADREKTLGAETAQKRRQRDAAARTLGGSAEEAVSTLRGRLNTIGHGAGLSDLRVSTAPVREIGTPAASAFTKEAAWKALQRQPDFLAVSAEFSGQGTLAQVVRALEIISDEPYVKRLERVTLRPRRAGEVVDLSISLTTLILPGTEAQSLPDPDVMRGTLFAALADKNMFRAPPAPPPTPLPVRPEVRPEIAENRPPPVPWGDWIVTGIARINGTAELWVRNSRTSESRQLRSGDRLLDAQIEEISDDRAVLAIDGTQYTIEIGQSLGDRRPLNQ